ncbi:MAG TPA: glycosyltransferase family 39 protein [Candidatus Acidoferrales bacterium]|nr:glycosyltransferase family 39 protein [Candidatus Acidoferrales bacterium]
MHPSALQWMLVVGFCIRVAVIPLQIGEHLNPAWDHWKFGWEMGRVARSLYLGHGFASPIWGVDSGPTAWLMPVYPLLMAACFKLFGLFTPTAAVALLTLNCAFGALTAVPVFRVAKRLLGRESALAAGWFWALSPYSIYLASARIWENTLTALLFAWILEFTYRVDEDGSWRTWLIWGALWASAMMTSATVLACLPFLLAWVAWRQYWQNDRRWILRSAALFALILTTLAPWATRNYIVFHRFMPLRSNLWLEVWVGNIGRYDAPFPKAGHPTNNLEEHEQWRELGEVGYMEAKKREVISYIGAHKAEFVRMTFRRAVYTWTSYWNYEHEISKGEPMYISGFVYFTVISAFSMVGVWFACRKVGAQRVLPIILVLLTFPLVYYVTHPAWEYRHPLDPLLTICAAHGWLVFRKRLSEQQEPRFEPEPALDSAGES